MTRHKALLNIVISKPSDFEPWGKENRDTSENCNDCSCGCKFYQPLEGKEGADWGVCFNPDSPRAGLLTFEHQGCQNFECDPEEEDVNT